jgi:hypothetical protein
LLGKCASTRVSERVSESSSLIVERHKHTSHHAFPEVLPHQAHACRQDEAEQARAQLDPHENRKHRPVSLPSHSLTHSLTHSPGPDCLSDCCITTHNSRNDSLTCLCLLCSAFHPTPYSSSAAVLCSSFSTPSFLACRYNSKRRHWRRTKLGI